MNDQYLAVILPWLSKRLPKNCEFCNGKLLKVSEYEDLFSIIGNTYGGDGITEFALPNLQSRTILGVSPTHLQATMGGVETVALNTSQIPTHSHVVDYQPNSQYESYLYAQAKAGTGGVLSEDPTNNVWGKPSVVSFQQVNIYSQDQENKMATDAIQANIVANNSEMQTSFNGANVPHENRPPFLTINFIIVVRGMYPQRSN